MVLTTTNGTSTDYNFYVDNILSKTITGVGTTLRLYDNIALGSGLGNASNAAYYDNFSLVYAVPEASSFLAVGAVGMLFAAARRLRRK